MKRRENLKRTPLLMVMVLSLIAMPLALKTIGVSVNYSCLASAAFQVWGSTMKTMGSLYHPSIAADFATFSNSFADENLNEPSENLVCRNEPPVGADTLPEIEIPEIEAPEVMEEAAPKPRYAKPTARIMVPTPHFDMVIHAEPVAVQITPEPTDGQLTPVAFRNLVKVKDLRKVARLAQTFAQAEVWKNYAQQEDEMKRRVEKLKASCNFAAIQALQENEKLFKVVVRVNTPAAEKVEIRLPREAEEVSEF